MRANGNHDSFPSDWPLVRLNTILVEVNDKVGRKRADDVPILSMTRHAGLILQSEKFDKRVASRDISSYKIVRHNQIVVGFPIDEGVIYALRRYLTGAVSPAYQVWQVINEQVDVEFLDRMLKTPSMIARYRQLSSLTVQRRRSISKQDFLNLAIPLPPLPEQRRIAAVLNAIQEAIAAQEDVIAAARHFKRSLMQRLFTYGPGREPAETKATEIGEIPAHWEVVTLSNIAEAKTSTSSPASIEKLESMLSPTEQQVLFLKVSDLNLPGNETKLLRSQQMYRCSHLERLNTVPPGAVIFPKRGGAIGTNKKRIAGYHSLLDPNLIAVIGGSSVVSEYLYFWFERFDLSSITDNTTIPQLNKKDVESVRVPLPPLDDQEKIVVFVETANTKIAAEEDRKTALEALFKSMLHQLMIGQIRLLTDEGLPLPKN